MPLHKKYYYHINGLKGFACLLILVGHYLGLYKYAQSFSLSVDFIDVVNNSLFSFLIDESYWLYLFFVVSGYLVSKSEITSITDVIYKSVNRFFRLAFPILFSYLVIYFIYETVGFHTNDANVPFQNQWFQKFYAKDYTIIDVLLGPLYVLVLGKSVLNGPYWVLRMMFFSSILIYFLRFLFFKLKSTKYESFVSSVLFASAIVSIAVSPIVTASLIGMLISIYEENGMKSKKCYAFWLTLISLLIYIMPDLLQSTFFFASLIIFTPEIRPLDVIFSSKPFQLIGNLSWGIYSFHWPIICSFGIMSIIGLCRLGLTLSYFISFTFVLVLTFIFSICFYYTFERLSFLLTKKIVSFFRK